MRYRSGDANRERTQHGVDRIHEASTRLSDAGNWLSKSKDQDKMSECPDVTIEEATIKDAKCMESTALEYSHDIQVIAADKVSSVFANAVTATKVSVDANEKVVARFDATKGGALL